jgi:hypothetical protein
LYLARRADNDLTFLVLIRGNNPTYRRSTSIVRKDASLADELDEAMTMDLSAVNRVL